MDWIAKVIEFIAIGAIGAALFIGVIYAIDVKTRPLIQQIGLVAIAIIIAASASAGISFAISAQFPQVLGPEGSVFDLIEWKLVASFGFMLTGMAAGYFNKLIDERRAKIVDMKQKGIGGPRPGIEFDVWDFFQPLLVSLITFSAIFAKVVNNDVVSGILIGFETGFFWQTVLSKRPATA